jgi:hypothetical protein
MQVNTKLILKAGLIASIITLILIGVFTVKHQDQGDSPFTPEKPLEQSQTMATDPFKEYFDKQQQDAIITHSQAQPSQPIQIVVGNSTTTVPVGTDPFKAFLDAQSKAKPEEAAISPFTRGK